MPGGPWPARNSHSLGRRKVPVGGNIPLVGTLGSDFEHRWVTAGKLLHGKRPRLFPIYDDKAVKPALHVTQRTVWEAFWCVFRHSDVRDKPGRNSSSRPDGLGSLPLARPRHHHVDVCRGRR
jgi:hypothetical protein